MVQLVLLCSVPASRLLLVLGHRSSPSNQLSLKAGVHYRIALESMRYLC